MIDAIAAALDSPAPDLAVRHPEVHLPGVYDVSGLAAATVGAAAAEVAALSATHGGVTGPVTVDRSLASQWFATSVAYTDDNPAPNVWDSIAGVYETSDGWIRLHTNAPHHKAAAVGVLGLAVTSERTTVAETVRRWPTTELETAIVDAGGACAEMRSRAAWAEHPQGQAVESEPLVGWAGEPRPWVPVDPLRPLAGLRVLDLTRVLAGPVATRFLAGWGADVLRIDPPDWHEPTLEADVTLGKRCARLDLRSEPERFAELVERADVVVHGYRPGALAALGYATFDGAVDVALDAYGWSGPWAQRRGFDSLVQLSCGIAHASRAPGDAQPGRLPVQALDHATGYLMAAAVVRALRGGPSRARLSLARTAALLAAHPLAGPPLEPAAPPSTDEATVWGTIRRIAAPVAIGALAMSWDRPAGPLGSHRPQW